MASGVAEKRLAVAAGMMISDVTSRMPTIFMANATTIARSIMKPRLTAVTGTPSTAASSS